MTQIAPLTPTSIAPGTPPEDPRLRAVAQELESTFLAEMLTLAGLGRTPEGFGGGPGEDVFSSLLTREQARLMTEGGGIGLSEAIYRSLAARREGA